MCNSPLKSTAQAGAAGDPIGFGVAALGDGARAAEAVALAAARDVGARILGPRAVTADRAPGPIRENFEALARVGLLGTTLPVEAGGKGLSAAGHRRVTAVLASYCGVTTFVQAQHHGPTRMIAGSGSEQLKAAVLADLAAGTSLCGTCFAYLRRPGPPAVVAKPCPGGWRLSGSAPWVTGWGLMKQFVVGAATEDGRFVYFWLAPRRRDCVAAYADIRPTAGRWGSVSASAPLALCAMNASATVRMEMADRFVPDAHLLAETTPARMQRDDRLGVLNGAAMPLGCASASVRLLCEVAERRGAQAIGAVARKLEHQLAEIESAIDELGGPVDDEAWCVPATRLRAASIALAVRAAHAAVTAQAGAANLLDNSAQRLYREAMFYTVQAQTVDVQSATFREILGA